MESFFYSDGFSQPGGYFAGRLGGGVFSLRNFEIHYCGRRRRKTKQDEKCDDLRHHRFVCDGQSLGFSGDIVRNIQLKQRHTGYG